jgi:4-diphosphocytidyl-2-C-methyl-D-erythritol kinase
VGSSGNAALVEFAAAKINLTLHVVGRRADGYHELESLVAFAGVGDRVSLVPGDALALEARGPFAAGISASDDNLVVKAARALAARASGLRLGRFTLMKRLPVASGIGGGSADAAAALRLLARANALSPDDPRLVAAAGAVGADVPVCVDPRPRLMRGIGEILSAPLALPPVAAVLVNPGVPVETKAVFAALARERARAAIVSARESAPDLSFPPPERGREQTGQASLLPVASPTSRAALFAALLLARNDLEPAAITIAPAIADVLDFLRATKECRLARMSGSGATCFALYDSRRAAAEAARKIREARPSWWTRATVIG